MGAEATTQAAKVLAALHDGSEGLDDLRKRTGLGDPQIMAALGSLSEMGLIELNDERGKIHARLTPSATSALSST